MSIFITGLAFTDPVIIDAAKVGVFTSSLLAGIVSFAFLRSTTEEQPDSSPGIT